MIRKTQTLDMVEEEVPQAPGNALGGVSRQTSGKIRKSAFDERQPNEAGCDPHEGSGQAVANIFAFRQHVIHKIA